MELWIFALSKENQPIRTMSFVFKDKLSNLRNVKGISKKKLKAQEYHLRRKMGICFKCNSKNHTHKKCPEKVIKNDGQLDVVIPPSVESSHEKKELPPQESMEKCTEKYNTNNMSTNLKVNKLDKLLMENLLKPLCPDLKVKQIPRHLIMNIIQQMQCNAEKNILDEMNPQDIHDLATSMIEKGVDKTILNALESEREDNLQNMHIEIDKYLPNQYCITTVDQKVVIPENKDIPDYNQQTKRKTLARKVGRPKKSTIGIETNEIHKFDIPITDICLDLQNDNQTTTTVDENYIPTVIERRIIPEKSDVVIQENKDYNLQPKIKKPTQKVGRPKKSTIGISTNENHYFARDEKVVDEIYHKDSVVISPQMSKNIENCLSISENYIPTVIESVIINNDSDRIKKSIKRVGRKRKST